VPRLRLTDHLGAGLSPLLAVASGLALLASHPPVGWWPLTFLAPPLLLAALTVDRRHAELEGRGVRAFRLGVLAGLATFAPLLSWLIMPAGYVGWGLLVLIQALWVGVLAALIRPALRHAALPVVAAVAWTGIDAWRAIVPLNGFEWGAIAYAHVEGSWLLPIARLVGGRGITFVVVLIGSAAFVLLQRTWVTVRHRDGLPVDAALRTARGPAALLVGGLLVSVLATIEPPAEEGSLDILVVQGNGVRHWETDDDPDPPLRIATALHDLTLDAIERDGRPDLTVWPESSLDRDPYTDRGAPLAALADDAAAAAGRVLTGASLDGPDPSTQRLIAALLLEDGFDEVDRYVKRRLVPFGEFVPFRALLDWFPPLEQIPRDAVPGAEPQSVEVVDGVNAAVLICFETMFSDVLRSNILAHDEPAALILAITNDASFGISGEPAQHLAQTRLRAVETGRWAVHGALSGSSAFVDPHGRASEGTELFTVDTIRAEIPLVTGMTPYLVIGDLVGMATRALAVALAALVLVGWNRRRRGSAGRGAAEVAPDGVGPERAGSVASLRGR
jgi:apolipoprotein N-acyltransferase